MKVNGAIETRHSGLPLAPLLAFVTLVGCARPPRIVPATAPSAGDEGLVACLERARVDVRLPGIAALRWANGDVREAVVGFRSLETQEPLRLGDPFHLGSVTKAMTATLAAILVERGMLRWEAPLREVFPDVNVHAGFAAVPLSALALHSAGFKHDPTPADRAAGASLGDGRTQRAALAARNAFGWGVARSRSTGERALSHSGGDGLWQTMIFVRPDGRRASLLATNIGDQEARLLELVRAIDDGRCSR
jgi:Beta-lactamase